MLGRFHHWELRIACFLQNVVFQSLIWTLKVCTTCVLVFLIVGSTQMFYPLGKFSVIFLSICLFDLVYRGLQALEPRLLVLLSLVSVIWIALLL